MSQEKKLQEKMSQEKMSQEKTPQESGGEETNAEVEPSKTEELKTEEKTEDMEESDKVPWSDKPDGLQEISEELDQLEQEEKKAQQPELTWQLMQKRYAKVQAFDYEDGCEILLIRPQDIGLLPRETWIYGNNSFLLHGYYNYRHLILARLENPQGNPRYLLGVPGHCYRPEKNMAALFGFLHFIPAKKQPEQDGRFGYWYADIRL
jgi:hypothetical protein